MLLRRTLSSHVPQRCRKCSILLRQSSGHNRSLGSMSSTHQLVASRIYRGFLPRFSDLVLVSALPLGSFRRVLTFSERGMTAFPRLTATKSGYLASTPPAFRATFPFKVLYNVGRSAIRRSASCFVGLVERALEDKELRDGDESRSARGSGPLYTGGGRCTTIDMVVWSGRIPAEPVDVAALGVSSSTPSRVCGRSFVAFEGVVGGCLLGERRLGSMMLPLIGPKARAS